MMGVKHYATGIRYQAKWNRKNAKRNDVVVLAGDAMRCYAVSRDSKKFNADRVANSASIKYSNYICNKEMSKVSTAGGPNTRHFNRKVKLNHFLQAERYKKKYIK